MKRRNFLKNIPATGIALASLTACTSDRTSKIKSNEASKGGAFEDVFDLNEETIDGLQNKMKQGALTSRNITEKYLKRIDEIDKKDPALNSIIEINPDALAIADEMDRERKSGKLRGPLHGIPILIKDNINTGDKMMTTAGSLALDGHRAATDAFIIKKLRNAGAVLLGKTNLSEWANFRSTSSSSGWSSRGGQTRNPFVLDRNPCGSSSGSGAAVSANLCAVAIGTETDGSIIAPASWCGIAGMKPSVGLLSRTGIIPISKTQDTAGPMARTVKDLAILLGVLAGHDPDDDYSLKDKSKMHDDYTKFLDADALKGKRIGIEKSFLSGNKKMNVLFKAAVEAIKMQGAAVVEVELMKPVKEAGEAEYTVLKYEFKDGVNRYLAASHAKVKSLAEVISFNKQHAETVMQWFDQDILEMCEAKGDLNSVEYLEALKKSKSAAKIIDELMQTHKLDAIAGTSIGLPGCIDLANGDYDTGFYFCPPAARAGYPHVTVPMGQVNGLPAGISFIAGHFKDGELLGISYAFEQATLKRKMPGFLRPFLFNSNHIKKLLEKLQERH